MSDVVKSPRGRWLIITAVDAERAALLRGLRLPDTPTHEVISTTAPIVVQAGGVGPAAAAGAAARSLAVAELALAPFSAVLSVGIAGGFAGRAEPGDVVIATRSVPADLGAESTGGFLPLSDLGLGGGAIAADADLITLLGTALTGAVAGEVLTVCTVTGTAQRAADLARAHPHAVAEAMEGFGVATAAAAAGVAFAELRAISNLIGPRDRSAWRVTGALAGLERAATSLALHLPTSRSARS